MNKILPIYLLCVICGLGHQSQGQEALISTSGLYTGSGGSLSFSVGLIVHKELSGPGGSMSQGVQVPKEVLSNVELLNFSNLISVYPNPVTNELTFDFGNHLSGNINCFIIGLTGEVLRNEMVNFNHNSILLEELNSGIYFLRLINEKQEIHTIKIIKL